MDSYILYGEPPRGLVDIPAGAVQCSPLVPGAANLAQMQDMAGATIYAPPGTIERRYVLALALKALKAGTPLTVLALKDKGGSRLAAELEAFGCEVVQDSRKHHRIVATTRPLALQDLEETIAAGELRQYPKAEMWTQPGVFSWDRLDVGSALLLKHLPAFSGAGADFGCGIGVLSRAVLASKEVSLLTCIDIDRRAIEAAKKNISDARVSFEWADVRTLNLSTLDFVVMNPPFHDTGIEDQALGQAFIERAATALKTGGQCWLTANRHLPYEALLREHFKQVMLVDEANGFKIYKAVK